MWNSFALALQLLTTWSVLDMTPTREEAHRAPVFFPVIGAMLGVIQAAVWTLGHRLWGGDPLVAAALTLAAGVMLTGGASLGAIARAADSLAALESGGDRTRAFAVMRDPRRGTTGLVALGVALALRLSFLAALPDILVWPGLALAGAIRGWAMAFAASAFPAAPEAGSAIADVGPGEFLGATALAIACGAALPTRLLPALLSVAIIVGPLAQTVSRRMGGINLPFCAALGEIAEIAALACLSAHL